ncbi:MAG: hypothetical protein ACLQT6_13455 [Desulfomonilaceae bacterium]
MRQTILEPLRWMEELTRVMVIENGGPPKTVLQVMTNLNLSKMCIGRPVEELPRILTILSPAHHLVSAMALDSLFNVTPPPLAVNMRDALLQTLFFIRHMRKLYFFLSSHSNPFEDFSLSQRNIDQHSVPRDLIDQIMRHVALAQEATKILGGRADHPISAVAGGVSRFLKQPYYDRLSEIGRSCLSFSIKLARVLADIKLEDLLYDFDIQPILSLTIHGNSNEVQVSDSSGELIYQFPADQIFEKIGLQQEPWTYKPFAFLKEKGWNSLDSEKVTGIYFVGPLARLKSQKEIEYPLSGENWKSFEDAFGSPPTFGIANAYRALQVEIFQAAGRMVDLYRQESLTGPVIRNIPTEIKEEGIAAIESPDGLIAHRYKTDSRGIVEKIEILDSATQNNAIKCLIAKRVVEESADWNHDPKITKGRIEEALLPF